ncbi:MAG TPA: hypothetical protein VIR31_00050, partial [Nitrososphaeraceae archaeon]
LCRWSYINSVPIRRRIYTYILGEEMPTANLGRVGFVNKGVWADGLHKINDLVTFGTAKYACIIQHTSTLGDIIPTNTTYWEKWTDYGIHSVTNISNTVSSSADSQYVNYFSGTNTGVLSIKITGLVTATASTVDLGFMEITITQDDRDKTSATNPPSYKFMIKGNMDTGVWYNCQPVLLGTSATVPINVRFTRTASDAYIEIGETSSIWYYPTVEVAHVSSYIIAGYTPVFLATIQGSLLGTTSDFILSAIPNSKKNENTLQSNVESASTCTIGTYLAGDTVHITGNTTINSFGVSTNGTIRNVVFDGVIILTHNNTSLILPTGVNITTAIGDTATFICENGASGYWRCISYQSKNGSKDLSYKSTPVTITSWSYVGTTITLNVASHTFVAGDYIEVSGLTATTYPANGIQLVTSTTSTTIVFTLSATPTGTAGVSSASVKGYSTINGRVSESIGVNQTWQDVTASRVMNTTYTNTTGKPIQIIITTTYSASTGAEALIVGGITVAQGIIVSTAASSLDYTAIVPNGTTYRFNSTSKTILAWSELR